MGVLIPDKTFFQYGLKINQKIIPDGTVWTKSAAGFSAGDLYKAGKPLKSITYVTIHNPGNGSAEVFARATWNQNMNSSRVHYYVDDKEAWQLLADTEMGWHAGDGGGPGNSTSLSIEICMGSQVTDPAKAEDNGALLTAILMNRHGISIDNVVPHKHWKRSNGSYKECPVMILPHWEDFIRKVRNAFLTIRGLPSDSGGVKGNYLVYTVTAGDSLSRIAKRYNVKVGDIQALNKLVNPDLIFVGQKLKIPSVSGTQNTAPDYLLYTVAAGDNLSMISKRFNTTVKILQNLNKIVDADLINAGQKLKIPLP